MTARRYGPGKGPKKEGPDALELVRRLRHSKSEGYREQSLRLHGNVCAKCGREFGPSELHLLTVHHKDGNRFNNPPDGSNWENLCVFCHEDEHSRGILGDYLNANED